MKRQKRKRTMKQITMSEEEWVMVNMRSLNFVGHNHQLVSSLVCVIVHLNRQLAAPLKHQRFPTVARDRWQSFENFRDYAARSGE